MEKQLWRSVESRGDRGMAWCPPFRGGFEQRLGLLDIGAERMIGDGHADALCRCAKIVPSVEYPVATVLLGYPRSLDQMPLPVEVVDQDDPVAADKFTHN